MRRFGRSIAGRLILLWVLGVLLLVVVATIAATTSQHLITAALHVKDHHLRESAIFEDIRAGMIDAVGQHRLYLMSRGDDRYHAAFARSIAAIRRHIADHGTLHASTPITPPEIAGINELSALTDEVVFAHESVARAMVAGRQAEAERISATLGATIARAAVTAAMTMTDHEREESDEVMAVATAAAARARNGLAAATVAAIVFGGAAAVSVIRSIARPLRRLVETTRIVDRGALTVRTGLASKDEVGELARSFDGMVSRLEASFADQDRFFADLSHELRTPITIVRGHLELAAMSPQSPEKLARTVGIAIEELDRMSRLADGLLVLARAERADFLRREEIDLPTFLAGVLEKAVAIAPRAWTLGPVAPVAIEGDRDRLTQALLNLLRNAAEHTRDGARIVLSAALRSGAVDVTVADEGTGIPEALLPHIFERFRHGHRTGERTGAGLGLSITRAIARAHGGDVQARSASGAGATFVFTLPRATEISLTTL